MIEIIGVIGLFLVLVAFVLILLKKVNESSKSYLFLNVLGGSVLIYYASVINSTPFLILQIAWVSIALIKLIIVLKQ